MLKNISFQHKTLYSILGLTIAACLVICLPVPIIARFIAVVLLISFLPGYLLLQVIGLQAADRLEQTMLAIGLSYGLTVVGSLAIIYVTGRLSTPLLLGSIGLIMLVLAVIGLFRPPPPRRLSAPQPFREAIFLYSGDCSRSFQLHQPGLFRLLGRRDEWLAASHIGHCRSPGDNF